MKYYWIPSKIEIKMAVMPCRQINTKYYVIFADFKSFHAIFIDLLGHFIDNFYNIFRSSKSGPWFLWNLCKHSVHP